MQLVEIAKGKPLLASAVDLFERNIGKDNLLVSGFTDSGGRFSVEWTAKKIDFFDDTAELYLKFSGDEKHKVCSTRQFMAVIK